MMGICLSFHRSETVVVETVFDFSVNLSLFLELGRGVSSVLLTSPD